MKKILTALCMILVCMLMPVMALAISQTEWDQQCTLKVKSTTDAYDLSDDILGTTSDLPLKKVGSVPGGTYVKRLDTHSGMAQITYLSDGSQRTVWVSSGALAMAVAHVDFDDGSNTSVPEALMNDKAALYKYLASKFPGYTFSGIEGSSVIHKEKSRYSNSAEEREEWKKLQDNAKGAAADLGVGMDDLDKAVVYAPRTGRASLRTKGSSKGKVIDQYKDGTIVGIVKKGKGYSQVLVNGKAGYMINSALEFLDPAKKPLGEGVISYKGNTTGRHKIVVRSEASSKARKIDDWREGTEVLIWAIVENKTTSWYEIEANGMRVFVEGKNLTVTELYADKEEVEEAEETDDEADAADDEEDE